MSPIDRPAAVFFDLQGTLGGEPLGDIRDFSFYPFARKALKDIGQAGYRIFFVTNQSHIAKGLLTQKDFDAKMQTILEDLNRSCVRVECVYCCPHLREQRCSCKKPSVYFLKQAEKEFCIHLPESYVVGDIYESDILMAKSAGTKSILVLTGQGKKSLEIMKRRDQTIQADFVASDALAAAEWILAQQTKNGEATK
jgi:histidinol-phosphate phosphatase family protein